MDLELGGKVVFVAGASRGIGRAIAEACLAEGAKVAMTARGADALEATRGALARKYGKKLVWAMAGDMCVSDAVEAAMDGAEKALGPVWGAVANVGVHPCPAGFDLDDETWDAGFVQNLDSAYRLSRAALRRMAPRKGGSVVLISSIAGMDAMGTPLTYGVAKAAVNHLAKELARISGPSEVRVNALAPGNILFPGGSWDERTSGPRAEAWKRWMRREVSMKRFGAPEEIGAVAAFMLSPRSSFLHGAVLAVDGGQTR